MYTTRNSVICNHHVCNWDATAGRMQLSLVFYITTMDFCPLFGCVCNYRSATKGSLMNSGWRPKRSFIRQINDFWTSITNVFPQNRTFWRQKKLRAVARVTNLFYFVSEGGSTLYWLARPGKPTKCFSKANPSLVASSNSWPLRRG